ncbi:MAG TPA: hypothetical protein EYP10_06215, partial [Armatimonadetes bacterium]|nr:hypothetical protein [Armatimonadota bacterium]
FGSPTQTEYFLLCNRQRIGFDQYLPGVGLTIWHIDKLILGDTTRYLMNAIQQDHSHKGIHMFQADGANDIDISQVNFDPNAFDCTSFGFLGWIQGNWGDAGDPYPGTARNTEFTFLSMPSSATYIGLDSGVAITDIDMRDTSVIARIRVQTKPEIYIIEPQQNEQLATVTPTIRARFTAPFQGNADIDPMSIVVSVDGQEVLRGAQAEFDSVTQSLEVKLQTPLSQGRHTIEISAANRAGIQADPVSVSFTIRPRSLTAGLHMISIPYLLSPGRDSPAYVVSPTVMLARYGLMPTAQPPYIPGDPSDYDYHYYDINSTDEYVRTLVPGRGYWVQLDLGSVLQIEGHTLNRQQPYMVRNESDWDALREADIGWQQFGNPFPFAIDTMGVQVLVDEGSRLVSFSEAVDEGVILPVVYGWDGERYTPQVAPDIIFEPFQGYWIKKLRPCRLVILPFGTPQGRKGIKQREREPAISSSDSWAIEIEALGLHNRAHSSTSVIIGVTPKAASGVEWHRDLPAPPAPPNAQVVMFLTPHDAGRGAMPLIADWRPATKRRIVWQLHLRAIRGSKEVRLRWRNLGRIPRNWQLTLVDRARDRHIHMRTATSYNVTVESESEVVLQIVAEPVILTPLRVSNVRGISTRGAGLIIQFALSQPARCEVTIMTLTGRSVRQLVIGKGRAGINNVRWDGRDAAGRHLSPGIYLCRVTATDELSKRVAQGVGVIRLK